MLKVECLEQKPVKSFRQDHCPAIVKEQGSDRMGHRKRDPCHNKVAREDSFLFRLSDLEGIAANDRAPSSGSLPKMKVFPLEMGKPCQKGQSALIRAGSCSFVLALWVRLNAQKQTRPVLKEYCEHCLLMQLPHQQVVFLDFSCQLTVLWLPLLFCVRWKWCGWADDKA